MRRNLLRIALALFIIFTASVVWAESSVWVVSSSKATVYLAGSFHVLRASDYPLPAEFFTAYNNSRKIIFEIPPDEAESAGHMGEFLSGAIYADGTTLKDHITKAAYDKAEKFCKERNYPLEQYQVFKPALFLTMLTALEMNRIGADPQKGVDYFFEEKALRDGKATGSLETVDQQLKLLLSMDESMGSDQIIESIDEFKQIELELSQYLAVWRKGDEARMEELFIKDFKGYRKLYQTLIVDRNNKWMTDITSYLNGSVNTMVIVGAAHLAGSDGLVNLLRKRGYKVAKVQKN
ncbi:MAG TPA: TraB/GumN family protein [Smithella sp.]|nr:TraB/GumN family protein [Smithella sp.]